MNRVLFSCDIPYDIDIHPTVRFGHKGLGIVINEKSPIGAHTVIKHRVTIGINENKEGRKKRIHKGVEFSAPIIGKNVFIGPGATILGPVIIGDNSKIGASAVVLQDVPEGKTAVGIPAKII